MNGVELVNSYDHEGLGAGRQAALGSIPWLEENQSERFMVFDFFLKTEGPFEQQTAYLYGIYL